MTGSPAVRRGDVAWVDSGDRVVVLRLDALADHPVVLAGSAAEIWRRLDTTADVADVVTGLADDFGAPEPDVDRDVRAFLVDAERSGVVVRATP